MHVHIYDQAGCYNCIVLGLYVYQKRGNVSDVGPGSKPGAPEANFQPVRPEAQFGWCLTRTVRQSPVAQTHLRQPLPETKKRGREMDGSVRGTRRADGALRRP